MHRDKCQVLNRSIDFERKNKSTEKQFDVRTLFRSRVSSSGASGSLKYVLTKDIFDQDRWLPITRFTLYSNTLSTTSYEILFAFGTSMYTEFVARERRVDATLNTGLVTKS